MDIDLVDEASVSLMFDGSPEKNFNQTQKFELFPTYRKFYGPDTGFMPSEGAGKQLPSGFGGRGQSSNPDPL